MDLLFSRIIANPNVTCGHPSTSYSSFYSHHQVSWQAATIVNSSPAASGCAALAHSRLHLLHPYLFHLRICVSVLHCSLSASMLCSLSSLRAPFPLSVSEHTGLTAEQHRCVHLVKDRLATSGTNMTHTDAQSSRHQD